MSLMNITRPAVRPVPLKSSDYTDKIRVTGHAIDQFRLRFPNYSLPGMGDERRLRSILSESEDVIDPVLYFDRKRNRYSYRWYSKYKDMELAITVNVNSEGLPEDHAQLVTVRRT